MTRRPDEASRSSHVQQRSELLRGDGDLRFRARCSCGWRSDPVDMGAVYLAWEEHRASVRNGDAVPGDDGV